MQACYTWQKMYSKNYGKDTVHIEINIVRIL